MVELHIAHYDRSDRSTRLHGAEAAANRVKLLSPKPTQTIIHYEAVCQSAC
jgi:hypothetical protein